MEGPGLISLVGREGDGGDKGPKEVGALSFGSEKGSDSRKGSDRDRCRNEPTAGR